MIVRPSVEKLIQENFLEYSFDDESENSDFTPSKQLFKRLNSAEQYYLAEHFNWDGGVEVLNWIIDSKKCDKGTASMIFWKAEPDFYMERTPETIEEYERDTFELLQKIIGKFRKNEFRRSRLKFDPVSSGYDTDAQSELELWELPKELRSATKGMRPISIGFFQELVWQWQRNQRLRKREKRKAKMK